MIQSAVFLAVSKHGVLCCYSVTSFHNRLTLTNECFNGLRPNHSCIPLLPPPLLPSSFLHLFLPPPYPSSFLLLPTSFPPSSLPLFLPPPPYLSSSLLLLLFLPLLFLFHPRMSEVKQPPKSRLKKSGYKYG